MVRLKAPCLDETIAVAHAPRPRASDDACAAWWEQFSNYATVHRIDRIMIVANGTTGQNAPRSIEDYGEPQNENRGGNHFRACLRERDFAAVNAACETEGDLASTREAAT